MNSTTERYLNTCNTSEYIVLQSSLVPGQSSRPQASVDLISLLFASTAILGFIGNFVTLSAFIMERKLLRKNFNLLLLNLTVADLFVVIFDLPFQVVLNQLGYWPFGVVECALLIFCDWGMTFVSIFTLVAISIDRYWAASYIQSYKVHNTRKRTLACIALIWAVLLVMWTPVFLVDRISAGTRHPEVCSVSLSDRRPYSIIMPVVGYHLPTLLMIFCYVRVYHVVRRDQRTITSENETGNTRMDTENPGDLQTKISYEDLGVRRPGTVQASALAQMKGVRRQNKVFLSLSYILTAYLLLWTPIQIVVDIQCFDSSLISIDLYYYFGALCYFNSALNPVLYAASSVQTRQAYRKVLCGR